MRSTLIAVLLSAFVISKAVAQDVVFGPGPGSANYGPYVVSTSAPKVVATTSSGTPLVGFTVSATNVGGSQFQDIIGITLASIGSNGALHHEQNLPGLGAAETPLASTFTGNGFAASTIDSHFLQDAVLALPGGDPAESLVSTPSGAVPEVGGQTGFGGELTGAYAFSSASSSVDIAYLVIEGFDGSAVDVTFNLANGSGIAEDFIGRFVLAIPEPASALLAGAALLGVAARRR